MTGVSIWAYLWRTSRRTCGAMNTDMSAFMGLSPNKDLKNGLIRPESSVPGIICDLYYVTVFIVRTQPK